jgi:hypothetical protein
VSFDNVQDWEGSRDRSGESDSTKPYKSNDETWIVLRSSYRAGRRLGDSIKLKAKYFFTYRSEKFLLRPSDTETMASSSRISKRTVSVRRGDEGVETLAADSSFTCCDWHPTDEGVNFLATAKVVVTMGAENTSGLWARDGESQKAGVPDVMSTPYCNCFLTLEVLILNILQRS